MLEVKSYQTFLARCDTGYCVDGEGSDVNDFQTTFSGFGVEKGKISKEDCVELCQEKQKELKGKVTACEYRKSFEVPDVGLNDTKGHVMVTLPRCRAHTLPIAKGNGRKTDFCCVYENDEFHSLVQGMYVL